MILNAYSVTVSGLKKNKTKTIPDVFLILCMQSIDPQIQQLYTGNFLSLYISLILQLYHMLEPA